MAALFTVLCMYVCMYTLKACCPVIHILATFPYPCLASIVHPYVHLVCTYIRDAIVHIL